MTVASFCSEKAVRECGTAGSMGVADKCVVDAVLECKPARNAVCLAWANGIQQQSGSARPFNPSRTADCLSRSGDTYRKSPIVPADLAGLDAVCERVFSGAKKKGDPCATDFECDGALVCDVVCADKTVLTKGAFCGVVPGSVCGVGLYCGALAGQPFKMCMDRPVEGQACAAEIPCLETLRCLGTSVCGARLGISQPCTSNDDCATSAPYCDQYVNNRCDTGFIPAPGTPECTTFGAPAPAAP